MKNRKCILHVLIFYDVYVIMSICLNESESGSRSVASGSFRSHQLAREASLSMGFSRLEYWNGLPCPSPGYLPGPRIEPGSPTSQADSLSPELLRKPFIVFV